MGKKCVRCGDHGWGVYIYSNGLCEKCEDLREEEEAKKALEARHAENYAACQKGTAKASVLRVYNAFVKKYPEAEIKGIGLYKDDDRRLFVNLVGDISYVATYDPLTNSVDVVEKRKAAPQESVPTPVKPAEKSFGGATFWAILALLYGLFLLLFNTLAGAAGIIASVVALGGCSTKSSTAVMWGGVLLIFPLIIGFPYSVLYFVLLLAILLCA